MSRKGPRSSGGVTWPPPPQTAAGPGEEVTLPGQCSAPGSEPPEGARGPCSHTPFACFSHAASHPDPLPPPPSLSLPRSCPAVPSLPYAKPELGDTGCTSVGLPAPLAAAPLFTG